MPTYFFHTYGGVEFVDEIGTECTDDAHAYCEGVKLIGTMLRDDPHILTSGQGLRAEVMSEAGVALFSIMARSAAGESPMAA